MSLVIVSCSKSKFLFSIVICPFDNAIGGTRILPWFRQIRRDTLSAQDIRR
jgi:hypothetical protein